MEKGLFTSVMVTTPSQIQVEGRILDLKAIGGMRKYTAQLLTHHFIAVESITLLKTTATWLLLYQAKAISYLNNRTLLNW